MDVLPSLARPKWGHTIIGVCALCALAVHNDVYRYFIVYASFDLIFFAYTNSV
jgi:hypothetical protein